MSGDRQLFRTGKNAGHGRASGIKPGEIKVLRDKDSPYHMHVYKGEIINNEKKS